MIKTFNFFVIQKDVMQDQNFPNLPNFFCFPVLKLTVIETTIN